MERLILARRSFSEEMMVNMRVWPNAYAGTIGAPVFIARRTNPWLIINIHHCVVEADLITNFVGR